MKAPRNEREAHAEMMRGTEVRPAEDAETQAPARTINALMFADVLLAGIAVVLLK